MGSEYRRRVGDSHRSFAFSCVGGRHGERQQFAVPSPIFCGAQSLRETHEKRRSHPSSGDRVQGPAGETKQYSPAGLDARVRKYESAVRSIPLVTPIPENHKEMALKRAFDREDAAEQAWAADTLTIKVLQNNVRRLRAAIDNAEEEDDTFAAMVMTGQLDIEKAKLEAATA